MSLAGDTPLKPRMAMRGSGLGTTMVNQIHWRQLDGFMLRARTLVDGLYSGAHPSPRQGPGLEFHDYRPYVPGDDLRAVDWKLYGRTDRYYLRRYRRYTDLKVHLLVDVSPSMAFAGSDGSSKLEIARTICAAIAMLGVKQSDRVGLSLADSRLAAHLPASSTWAHLQRLTAMLEQAQPNQQALLPPIHGNSPHQFIARGKPAARSADRAPDLPRAMGPNTDVHARSETGAEAGFTAGLQRFARVLTRPGLVVIVSDFLDDPGDLFDGLARLRHRRCEIIVFQVLTPEELDLRRLSPAHVRLQESEGRGLVQTHLPQVAGRYKQLIDQHIETLRRHCRALGIDHTLIPADQPPLEALGHYLIWRRHQ